MFQVVPYLVKSKLEDHEHIHAEVCPGGWSYHHVNTAETSALLQSHHDWTPGHPLNLIIKLELLYVLQPPALPLLSCAVHCADCLTDIWMRVCCADFWNVHDM